MIRALVAMEPDPGWDTLPPEVEVRFCGADEAAIDAALDDDIEILLTDAMPSSAKGGGGLRWIQLLSAGTDQLNGHPLMQNDLRISNAAGSSAVHIAEFVLARLLYHIKEFRTFGELQREHRWPDRVAMSRPSLRGRRALIIGYGGVGRETARLLAAHGMHIIAAARDTQPKPYRGYASYPGFGDPDGVLPERYVTLDALHDVLPDADAIILAVPLTDTTRYVIDAQALARTKASAILINIARGGVVDTSALLEGLDAGRLAHAYLDVFEQEPLPPDSPLWDHPRISITPHMAGVMPDVAPVLRDLFRQNLQRYMDGQPLINELDRQRFL